MPDEPGIEQPSRIPDDAMMLYECAFTRDRLGAVRAALGREASVYGLTGVARFNLILAVNELATNAIVHGGGRGHVRIWRHGDALWCEVQDSGHGIAAPQFDRMCQTGPHQHGHGLWLARHICATLHIDTSDDGTRILLSYPTPASQSITRS